ncbi:DUF6427 family protein [Tenacibaculum jejuense]|uniref:Uncharacterized protein n=1 Tax=Tenacibaculum jejuense TaxID=584609 RepID=A0A238UEY6_9FLAO|nr:DUF6427 family protein [Tenacibaculum jejuense]SNR17615.1 conserved membrane protein of unknown function [Tenacibaculum jejuense]
MLTNFFSTTKPVNSMFIIGLFACYVVTSFFTNYIDVVNIPLFLWFLTLFGIVNFVNSRNNLTFDNSYFFLFFCILLGFFPEVFKINTLFYSNLILIIYIRRVYSFQSSKNIIKKLFDSGFWIGISFLIEPYTLLFFPLTFIGILVHEHIDVRRIFTPIIGFSVPIILYFTYCFWYSELENFYNLLSWKTNYDFSIYNTSRYIILFSLLLILITLASILKTPKTFRVKNTFRKSWILICFHFFFSLVLVVLLSERSGTELLYIIFPAALIIANGFELFQKKWYSDIILIGILSASLLSYFS